MLLAFSTVALNCGSLLVMALAERVLARPQQEKGSVDFIVAGSYLGEALKDQLDQHAFLAHARTLRVVPGQLAHAPIPSTQVRLFTWEWKRGALACKCIRLSMPCAHLCRGPDRPTAAMQLV